jgi:hypothetical protein
MPSNRQLLDAVLARAKQRKLSFVADHVGRPLPRHGFKDATWDPGFLHQMCSRRGAARMRHYRLRRELREREATLAAACCQAGNIDMTNGAMPDAQCPAVRQRSGLAATT